MGARHIHPLHDSAPARWLIKSVRPEAITQLDAAGVRYFATITTRGAGPLTTPETWEEFSFDFEAPYKRGPAILRAALLKAQGFSESKGTTTAQRVKELARELAHAEIGNRRGPARKCSRCGVGSPAHTQACRAYDAPPPEGWDAREADDVAPTPGLSRAEEGKLVKECFENFPEASAGSALRCIGWKYEAFRFTFEDEERPGARYVVNLDRAVKGLRLLAVAVARGELPGLGLPASYLNDSGEWDALAFDALAQMAVFGEVIYG